MQAYIAANNDDPILWELCKTSALTLTEKRADEDAIEKHRNETEAEQDRFKKSSGITRIKPTVTAAGAGAIVMDESRNDVPSSSDNRAAAIMSMIAPTATMTPTTTQPEKRQRGGWWRRAVSSSTEAKEKSFTPSWVLAGKGAARQKSYTSNLALASNESSGIVVESPTTTALQPKQTTEAREDVEQGENIADNWSLSESIGKLMNDTRQHRVVYRHFGPKPMQSLKVEQTGDMPTPEHEDHVVVKIMVSMEINVLGSISHEEFMFQKLIHFNTHAHRHRL
jgi:hypothetical protein